MVKTECKVQSPQSKKISPSAASCKKKYKGVRMRSWGSWVSEIRAPHQKTRIWLGSYSTAEAAARAYDVALLCLKGSSANLNFPNASPPYIPKDTVLSPKSIQRVAAAAANSFQENSSAAAPHESSPSSSSVSSPSPSDQLDDDASLMTAFPGTYASSDVLATMPLMESDWYSFDSLQSPRYIDHMFNSSLFDQPTFDDFLEEDDIRLWSFC